MQYNIFKAIHFHFIKMLIIQISRKHRICIKFYSLEARKKATVYE